MKQHFVSVVVFRNGHVDVDRGLVDTNGRHFRVIDLTLRRRRAEMENNDFIVVRRAAVAVTNIIRPH